jgi:glutamate-1-semialdehyde 2,1-aminomutase
MLGLAEGLENGLREHIAAHHLPWTVTRLGARLELQFMPHTPVDAQDVADRAQPELERLTHLFMLNRGVLLTPFHSMMLVSPATQATDVERLLAVFGELCGVLQHATDTNH